MCRHSALDGPPCSYSDIDAANCLFLIGHQHRGLPPGGYKRIKQRKLSAPDEVTIICVDPRRTETADFADLHLPIRPGTDIALLNAMLYVLLDANLIDREFISEHTNGFADLLKGVKNYAPKIVEENLRHPRMSDRRSGADLRQSEKRVIALEHGSQSEQRRRAQEQRDQ